MLRGMNVHRCWRDYAQASTDILTKRDPILNRIGTSLALSAALALCLGTKVQADGWYPYPAQQIVPAFAADGKPVDLKYIPLAKADKPWNICVSFPHMKDAYWLGVD